MRYIPLIGIGTMAARGLHYCTTAVCGSSAHATGVLVYKTHTTDFVIIDVLIPAPTPAPTADSAHIT